MTAQGETFCWNIDEIKLQWMLLKYTWPPTTASLSPPCSSSLFCCCFLTLVFIQFVSKCVINQCVLLDKNVAIQHWESQICKSQICKRNTSKHLKISGLKWKWNHWISDKFSSAICHLMKFQWQRAPVVIFFAVKLSTISALLLAHFSCQTSTWRHIPVLLSAIFCSIYLTLKDVLASGVPTL